MEVARIVRLLVWLCMAPILEAGVKGGTMVSTYCATSAADGYSQPSQDSG
jgi:hypothetical protein